MLVLTLMLCLRSGSALQTVQAPAVGETYTWNILATNGPVSWYTNYYTFVGNTSLAVQGKLTYTLTGQHPDDEFMTNLTGNVWYGNFTIWNQKTSGLSYVKSWTRSNCSQTEIGNDLALSVDYYAPPEYTPLILWSPGLLVQTNWTENTAILSVLNDNTVAITQNATDYTVTYNEIFQVSTLTYDKATGVLVYANTTAGNYYLQIKIEPLSTQIPGFQAGFVFLAIVPAIAVLEVLRRTRSRP
jgi:hypothetical protein